MIKIDLHLTDLYQFLIYVEFLPFTGGDADLIAGFINNKNLGSILHYKDTAVQIWLSSNRVKLGKK